MNPNPFHFSIHLERLDQLLLWLMLLCLLGFILTSWAMMTVSKFFLIKNDSAGENSSGLQKFSIMDLELPWVYEKFQGKIKLMPAKTKDAVRLQLKLDYYFMPFAYLFLFFGGCFVLWCYQNTHALPKNYSQVLWIPIIAWLFDIIENKLIASSLATPTKTKARMILFFASVKWLLSILFLLAGIILYIMLI